jgi:STE24 endopeptidase
VAAAFTLGASALAPVALVVALRTRWPTDGEREAVVDVLGDYRLRIVDDRTRVGSALAAGLLPGARYVFLTESVLATLDDEEVRAVVAHEVGHHEREHVLLRSVAVAVVAGAVLALVEVAPGLALVVLAVGAVPAAAAFAWVVRTTERRADAYAARAVGGRALASALDRLAERHYLAASPPGPFAHHPPLAARIAALRGETGAR